MSSSRQTAANTAPLDNTIDALTLTLEASQITTNTDVDRLTNRLPETPLPHSTNTNSPNQSKKRSPPPPPLSRPDPRSAIASSSNTPSPSITHHLDIYLFHYDSLIVHDPGPHTLAHAMLPTNQQVLDGLSTHMADQAYKRYRMGSAPILPPVTRPCYPYWLPRHEGNYAIEGMVKKGLVG